MRAFDGSLQTFEAIEIMSFDRELLHHCRPPHSTQYNHSATSNIATLHNNTKATTCPATTLPQAQCILNQMKDANIPCAPGKNACATARTISDIAC